MLDKLLDKLYPLRLRWYGVRPVRRVELEIRDRTIHQLQLRLDELEPAVVELESAVAALENVQDRLVKPLLHAKRAEQ